MVNPSITLQYITARKNLILLAKNTKIPISGNSWNNTRYENKQIIDHNGNLGWAIGEKNLVIDIDVKKGGIESWDRLCSELDIYLDPHVLTPSGGWHIYLSLPELYVGFDFNKHLKAFPGIDFLSKGSYCVIPGSTLPNGKYTWYDDLLGGFETVEAPEALLDLIIRKNVDFSNNTFDDSVDSEDEWINEVSNPNGVSEGKVKELLSQLDNNMPNDEWVKVGMALYEWDKVDGLRLWEEWSIGGETYEVGQTETRWRSFKHMQTKGVTLGTVFHMVKEVNYDKEEFVLQKALSKIKMASKKDIEFQICPELKKLKFKDVNRDILAGAIQSRFKDLQGIKLKIQDARSMIKPTIDVVTGTFVEQNEKPSWCNEWVYINSLSAYFNTTRKLVYKTEGFNLENGKFVPFKSENGNKISAHKYVSDHGYIDVVYSMIYIPYCKDDFVYINGNKYVNTYNSETKPSPATSFTEEGLEAIEWIKRHINIVCNEEEYGAVLLDWITHNIQNPGVKVLWSVLIQSIEGIGKSFFTMLLRYCLGEQNVGTVSPNQISSDFNGWAANRCVNIFEEIKVKGHNRYEVLNSIKPLITDEYIMINSKGVNAYQTLNTTNYISFTNELIPVPISETDRRFFVIMNNFTSLKDVEPLVNMPFKEYFSLLFDKLRNYHDEIHKWFLERDISESFKKMKQAPDTVYKQLMISTERSNFEGLDEISDMIKKGGKYYNTKCISASDLFNDFEYENPGIVYATSKRSMLLRSLGYLQLPSPVTLDGKSRRIWVRTHMDNAKVKQIFKFGVGYYDL